jgi:auxin efflux carrier family protein
MFMNSNSLPIAMMQSLVVTVPSLKFDKHDTKNDMIGRALTYLMLYSTLGMVVSTYVQISFSENIPIHIDYLQLRWSYGVRLLSQADDEVVLEPTEHITDERTPLLEGVETAEPETISDLPEIEVFEPAVAGRPGLQVRQSSRFYNSFPNSPNQSRVNLSTIPSSGEVSTGSSTRFGDSDQDTDLEDGADQPNARMLPSHIPRAPSPPPPSPSKAKRSLRAIRKWIARIWRTINDFMTVPLWAALTSTIVACVPTLQHALQNHMQPVKGALAAAGNCSIPLTLIVLGAYFHPTPTDEDPLANGKPNAVDAVRKQKRRQHRSLVQNIKQMFEDGKKRLQQKQKDSGEQRRPGETKTIVIAVVSRMIITPIILLPLMAFAARFDIQEVFAE